MADEAGNVRNSNAGKFWQLLQEMEENDEHERPFSGSLGYPGFIQAIYHGRVQIGFEDKKIK